MPLSKSSIPKEYWALAAILLLAVFVASPGFFSIDEAVYYLGARAIAENGSLALDNGYHQLHSESLRLRFLIDGPQGLTPQYPVGSALLAAPLIPFLGARAFIVLNVCAAIFTLVTMRKICLSQFKSELIWKIAAGLLMFGTFWLEYAVGVWPHTLSAFFALQAYWFALRHLQSKGDDYRDALLSGLFAGAGGLFRLDALFAVPAIGLIFVLFAPRFVRSSLIFGVGVAPSLGIATWLAWLKFGAPNPFSYGQAGGNTDLTAHGGLLVALCLGLTLLVLFRFVPLKPKREVAIPAMVLAAGAVFFIPATNDLIVRCLRGFWALVVDIRTIDDPRAGVKPGPGGTLLFWTLMKKSLGQSMPWIGLMAALLTSGVPRVERRFIATLLFFIATMIMPFILLSWHGGGGSNMRYFLPVLPALAILCARVLRDLWLAVPNSMSFAAAGVWGVTALGVAWFYLHPSRYAGVQQIVAMYLFLATAVTAFAAGYSWRFQQVARKLAVALFGGGLMLSTTSALSDFRETNKRRAMSYDISLTVASLPTHSLVITFPEWAALRVPGNGSILASREPEHQRPDWRLIVDALDQNYRVFMTSFEFDSERDVPPGTEASETNYRFPGGRMIELRRMAKFSGAEQSGASR